VGGFTGFKEMPGVQMPGGWVYTGAHLQEEIEHLFPTLPDRPVCLGDTWTRKAFGVNIEYRLMDEVKLYGYDCVRIFAKIWDAQSKTRRKDQSGNEITVERGQPYSDIYYIAYKEGMMLYRFSVSSYGWYKIFNANNEIVNDRIMDSLYETFISFQ
jgi:hypothetical protein